MAGKLTARRVETAKPGKYSDGGNLYLIVSETGARKWVLRFTWRQLIDDLDGAIRAIVSELHRAGQKITLALGGLAGAARSFGSMIYKRLNLSQVQDG